MTGTISFGGIGSGIDTESIVSGLISASAAGLSPLRSRSASISAATSTISEIASLMGTLKSATEELDTFNEVGAYSATSSSDAIEATTNASALPGRVSVTVNQLASEQRTYSNAFASNSDALSIQGDLNIQVGTGDVETISVESSDSLQDIAEKINGMDSRVAASIVFDGNEYRLQVRGLDSGEDNAMTFSGAMATSLGLDVVANTVQQAENAEIEIDGFTITSSTNQVNGALPGVSLSLNEVSATPIEINVETDTEALTEKLNGFVSAYNAVVERIHQEAGFGAIEANNPVLAGDSSLRTITTGLSRAATSAIGGEFGDTLASVGISLNNDGTLSLDETELTEAIENDSANVQQVLAGDDTEDGVMDILRDLVDGYTATDTGLLDSKETTLNDRAEAIDERIEREEARLDVQAELLRRQFSAMDTTVATNQATLDYLIQLSLSG